VRHVEERVETGAPQTAQIVWLGVPERSCTIAAVLPTLQRDKITKYGQHGRYQYR
jgi:hypothetical protein